MSDEAIRRVDKYSRASGYDRGTPNPPKTRRCNNCAHRQSEHGGDGQGYICKLMRKCVLDSVQRVEDPMLIGMNTDEQCHD